MAETKIIKDFKKGKLAPAKPKVEEVQLHFGNIKLTEIKLLASIDKQLFKIVKLLVKK